MKKLNHRERGLALITTLMLVVVMTLLGLSMFRSFGLSEKIAGNTREKQRSLQAAQSALGFGEYWLSQGNGTAGVVCDGVFDASVAGDIKTCSNALTNPTALPWANRGEYTPPGMAVVAAGGTSGGVSNTGDINYYKKPSFYISYLGLDASGQTLLYQVTAAGYGGSQSAASVVQSTYAITPSSTALDAP
jgi:type IV pilus assembly protein PilX